jgi:hypothetical protein
MEFERSFLTQLLTSGAGAGPVMSDGKTLFDASHGNVAAAAAPPDVDTLAAARLAMRKQTGLAGNLIDVTPWGVLVPPDLETDTEKLLTQIRPIIVDAVNPFSQLQLIVEPRLTDPAAWYVVADPASAGDLEYCYLAGFPGPQTETRLGFTVDGIELKIRLDFGAGFVDWRGWYRNPGQ